MNCDEAELYIQESIDIRLNSEVQQLLDLHLTQCINCSKALRDYQQLSINSFEWAAKSVATIAPNDDLDWRIIKVIEALELIKHTELVKSYRITGVVSAATIAVAIIAGFYISVPIASLMHLSWLPTWQQVLSNVQTDIEPLNAGQQWTSLASQIDLPISVAAYVLPVIAALNFYLYKRPIAHPKETA